MIADLYDIGLGANLMEKVAPYTVGKELVVMSVGESKLTVQRVPPELGQPQFEQTRFYTDNPSLKQIIKHEAIQDRARSKYQKVQQMLKCQGMRLSFLMQFKKSTPS